jgi:hypothetical protein
VNLSGLRVELYVLDTILIEKHKKLFDFFMKFHLETPVITQPWFMSLFVGILPIETTFRIWDSFFYEVTLTLLNHTQGYKILYRISLTLFSTMEKKLLRCKGI